MASVLAVVSKKVFDKDCACAKVGALFPLAQYASTNKGLDALGNGDTLFVVTARDEDLWLVAVLENPKKTADGWLGPKNTVPVTNVSALRSQIRFTTGAGITTKPGALGMSLQTPRELTAKDEALLRAAFEGAVVSIAPPPPSRHSPSARIVYSAEAEKYLRGRTPADLEADSPKKRKERAKILEDIAAQGGLEKVLEQVVSETAKVAASDIDEALILASPAERAGAMRVAETAWNATQDWKLHSRLLGCFPDRDDWAAALARELLAEKKLRWGRDLLLSTLTDRDLLLEIAKEQGVAGCVINVVPKLGERAASLLGDMLEVARFPNEEKALCRALGCIGTLEAATVFSRYLRRTNVRSYATEFFARFAELAHPALDELAKKRTQAAEVARLILTSIDRASTNEAIAESTRGEEATDADLPRILREPPWTRKPKKRKPIVVPGLEPPKEPQRLHWSARSRQRFFAEHSNMLVFRNDAPTLASLEKVARGEKVHLYANFPPEVALPLFNAEPSENVHIWRETSGFFLARYGEKVLDAVCSRDVDGLPDLYRLTVESPRFVASFAKTLRKLRRDAYAYWLDRYPEAAALGLIPVAVGEEGVARDSAELGIHYLADHGHLAVVKKVAAHYGNDAMASLEEILTVEPTMKKPPKMPAIYRPVEVRAPRLRNGKTLSVAAMETLDQLLAASDIHFPVAGLDEIREACDARSLAEHVWDLAKIWEINGAKAASQWMLQAVAHFGDDEVVRRLTPALKADGICAMLGAIGTDAALMELMTIQAHVLRETSRPRYAWGVEHALSLLAARRGVELDELQDHFVPTCDVDDEGGVALDLGKRSYRLTFDAQLTSKLLDEDGNKVAKLPKPDQGDDPVTLAAAQVIVHDLDEDVHAIADLRATSLERAMIDGRTWLLEDFADVWHEHPLMKHMARGVLWEARTADGVRAGVFRVAEDGSFADIEDGTFTPPKSAIAVGVVHPARLTEEERKRWRSIFADYEILQPFDQLTREPASLTAAELSGSELTRTWPQGAKTGSRAPADRLRVGLYSVGRLILCCENETYVTFAFGNTFVTGTTVKDGYIVPLGNVDEVVRCELVRALDHLAASTQ